MVISALKMAGQIENMQQCSNCLGFIPYMKSPKGYFPYAINDCNKHVPEIRVQKPKKAEKA